MTGFDSDGGSAEPSSIIREKHAVVKESKLARKKHWDATFQIELENYENNGEEGENWYGKDVQKKTVQYIMEVFCPETEGSPSLSLLDIGTGNGALLFKLTKKGIFRKFESVLLKGIDYSEHSVVFASRVKERLSTND